LELTDDDDDDACCKFFFSFDFLGAIGRLDELAQ
jgi:hypothetical protein